MAGRIEQGGVGSQPAIGAEGNLGVGGNHGSQRSTPVTGEGDATTREASPRSTAGNQRQVGNGGKGQDQAMNGAPLDGPQGVGRDKSNPVQTGAGVPRPDTPRANTSAGAGGPQELRGGAPEGRGKPPGGDGAR